MFVCVAVVFRVAVDVVIMGIVHDADVVVAVVDGVVVGDAVIVYVLIYVSTAVRVAFC